MPRANGLRDDDVMGRLGDIERRLDVLEQPTEKPSKKGDKAKE